MARLTDYTRYGDAQRHYSREALWALFDGDAASLNIAHECVDRHAAERGGEIAVRIAHASGRDEAITFAELSAWSGRVATELQRLGVRAGERVALMLEPSLPFYATLFGIMKLGATAVPLFTLFGPDGLRLRLDDCTPTLLLLAPEKRELAGCTAVPVIIADDAWLATLGSAAIQRPAATTADDMALFQYTSGTTRELPEAVRHRHRAIVTVAVSALYASGIRPGDRFMCPSSPAWGHGLWHGTLAPLALGVSIAAYAGKFDPARLMQAIADYGITNLSAAATHYRMMKNAFVPGRHAFTVEKLSFTGEPIDSDTAAWAQATFGHPVCSVYGTTEVGVILGCYPGAADFAVKPGSLGKPMPGVEVAVVDGEGRRCAPNTLGELVVRRGERWVPTKDLGRVDEDGYYFHHGRADDVIISAGWTMSAVEIEDTLLKHPDIAECAAIGVPDPTRGQVVKAFVVSRRAPDDAFIAEIQQFTQTRLSRHEYPRQLEFVAELPKTPAGKVNRKALRTRQSQEQDTSKT